MAYNNYMMGRRGVTVRNPVDTKLNAKELRQMAKILGIKKTGKADIIAELESLDEVDPGRVSLALEQLRLGLGPMGRGEIPGPTIPKKDINNAAKRFMETRTAKEIKKDLDLMQIPCRSGLGKEGMAKLLAKAVLRNRAGLDVERGPTAYGACVEDPTEDQLARYKKYNEGPSWATLYSQAKQMEIPCRSFMDKDEIRQYIDESDANAGKPKYGHGKDVGCAPVRYEEVKYSMGRKRIERIARQLGIKTTKKDGKPKKLKYLIKQVNAELKDRQFSIFDEKGMSPANEFARRNPKGAWWKSLLPGNGESSESIDPEGRGDTMARSFLRRRNPRHLNVKFRRRNPEFLDRLGLGTGTGVLGTGLTGRDFALLGASLAGILAVDALATPVIMSFVPLDLSGAGVFTSLFSLGLKILVGLGLRGALLKTDILKEKSTADMLFIVAVATAAIMPLAAEVAGMLLGGASDAVSALSGTASAYPYMLGETVRFPATTGNVMTTGLGGVATAYPFGLGETVRFPAQTGQVMTTGLGEISYNPDGLGGVFYAGNGPFGSGDHPDFMNQVPGNSALSAMPDFMR